MALENNNTQEKKEIIKNFISKNLLALFILLLVLSSIIYNFFYFKFLGLNINIIPINVIDYFNNMNWSWLVLLPPFVYIVPLFHLFNYTKKKITIFFLVLILLMCIFSFIAHLNFYNLLKYIFILILMYVLYLFKEKIFTIEFIFFYLSLLFISMISFGIMDSQLSLNNKKNCTIIFKNNNKLHSIILRNFSDGILIKNKDTFQYIFKDNIKTIIYEYNKTEEKQ